MKKRILDWLSSNKTIAIQCIAVFAISIIATMFVVGLAGNVFSTNEGFDFRSRNHDASSGPVIGETIDLNLVKSQDGRTLAEVAQNHTLFMIAIIDPQCPACKAAESQMMGISSRLVPAGIPYYVLMLTRANNAPEYFAYADSLGLSSTAFVWRTDESQPPSSLATMVIPSHLLLNRNGVVVDKWPGTHQDPVMRQRMINQTTADALRHLDGSKTSH